MRGGKEGGVEEGAGREGGRVHTCTCIALPSCTCRWAWILATFRVLL